LSTFACYFKVKRLKVNEFFQRALSSLVCTITSSDKCELPRHREKPGWPSRVPNNSLLVFCGSFGLDWKYLQ